MVALWKVEIDNRYASLQGRGSRSIGRSPSQVTRQTSRGRTCRPGALREGGALRELRKGDTPELGKAFTIARGTRLQGPIADIGRSGPSVGRPVGPGRISNLRSIPPRTSTAIGRGSSSTGASRSLSRRQHEATFAGGNHARRPLTAPGPSLPLVPETVEPVVDIFDERDCILVIAEVPGAEQGSIRFELENHALCLDGALPPRFPLPAATTITAIGMSIQHYPG